VGHKAELSINARWELVGGEPDKTEKRRPDKGERGSEPGLENGFFLSKKILIPTKVASL
jgi:hypothetical protein